LCWTAQATLCDVNVRDKTVSRQHAALLHAEKDSFIQARARERAVGPTGG